MSYDLHDTICAIATANGGGARGMVRVSGPNALSVVGRLFQAADGSTLKSLKQATALPSSLAVELHGRAHVLPCDLFLWPTERSYTRQPVAELHTLGSPPLLESLLAAVCRAGARLAEPGEFTLRAFLAGRIDLTQAEAVLGVIDARGDDELGAALTQLAGGLARPLQCLRDELIQLLAELEAGLDFVDEDIRFISPQESLARLASVGETLAGVAQQLAARSTARSVPRVVLVGLPNVGKSSLFNELVSRHGISTNSGQSYRRPALVSPERGTTRDYLTAILELGNTRCELVDTAGVEQDLANDADGTLARHSTNAFAIDSAAQGFAKEQRAKAAIRLCCVDASVKKTRNSFLESNCEIVALTKSDIVSRPIEFPAVPPNVPVCSTSSHTGTGLDTLVSSIRELLMNETSTQTGQVVGATADRCRECIRLADQAVQQASNILSTDGGDELASAELRTALSELGKVVGAVYTDDLLDRIFSTFCIGK